MKKKAIAVGIVFLLLVAAMLSLLNDRAGVGLPNGWKEIVLDGDGNQKIAVIDVEGAIVHDSTHLGHPVLSMLEFARKDPQVKGVLLSVNSPGGDVVTVDDIHNKIEEIRQQGKPVVVSMDTIAASGGYYISAGADRIFAHSSTITGSLGVIITFSNYKELAERVGYSEVHIKSGPMKDIGDPLRTMSEEERKVYQNIVDVSYDQFVDVIAKGRNLSKDEVLKLADGRVYSGMEAKSLGLVDEFGTIDDAIKYIKQKAHLSSYKTVQYAPKSSILNILSKGVDATSTVEQVKEMLGVNVNNGPQLLYMLE